MRGAGARILRAAWPEPRNHLQTLRNARGAGGRAEMIARMRSLIVGFGLGFVVAAQLGPMSLFLIRSTLRGSLAIGLAIGAGIAAIDTLYASVGAAGAAPVLTIGSLRTVFGALGAVVLVYLGARTLWTAFRVRMGGEADGEASSPRRAFLTSLGATASNPLTIASWAAIFAGASAAGAADTASTTAALLAGVGLGSLTWVSGLALAVSAARRRVGPRTLRTVDACAGAGLLAFGGALALRTLER
jgi:putative LysE/RhtB family amino acid efflux pump